MRANQGWIMMTKGFIRARRFSLFLLVSVLFSAGAVARPSLSQADLQKRYQSAVVDAATAEPSEISKNLVAIVPSNPQLIWKNKGDTENARILVVTWTSYNGYDDKIGQPVPLSREVWVTTAPEIKNFCKTLKKDRSLRLEQLLGLPPKAGKTKFVEMWVRPGDLFRPSADPEISDSEAETTFRTANRFVTVSADYIKWYTDLQQQSYGANGYPWTRLGYTYDWGNKRRHVGLSEFVIIPGSTVEINSISPTANY
ncbi:MAG: hypothetical protein HGA99_04070 [Chlorobiaceae bacterium]|nr:hypothetical protein [Chlorobiaceae bacterium]